MTRSEIPDMTGSNILDTAGRVRRRRTQAITAIKLLYFSVKKYVLTPRGQNLLTF